MAETYETIAKGIRILPGQWRPHYPWEHIAWVSPPWPGHDYIWLDFPEAVFTNLGLMFLSHVNPPFPTVFQDLPKVPWRTVPGGIAFERVLPNGVRFGGAVTKSSDTTVLLDLYFVNGGKAVVKDIKLQTCAYLRAIEEFSDLTMANKFAHVPGAGWLPFEEAQKHTEAKGSVKLGWHWGPQATDLPVIVTRSGKDPRRLVAMTWHEHTDSITGNPHHPCMHADPIVPPLEPGERVEVRGELLFFEGSLDDFGDWFLDRRPHAGRRPVPQ